MLVLSRREGERICIADDIVITLVSVEGSRARIGIEAPHDVAIDRQEVHDRKKLECPCVPRILRRVAR